MGEVHRSAPLEGAELEAAIEELKAREGNTQAPQVAVSINAERVAGQKPRQSIQVHEAQVGTNTDPAMQQNLQSMRAGGLIDAEFKLTRDGRNAGFTDEEIEGYLRGPVEKVKRR